MKCLSAICLISILFPAVAQKKTRDQTPLYTLELLQTKPLSVTLPSPMLEGTVGCTSDGSLVINSILEADPKKSAPLYTPEVLSVIDPKGEVQSFDFSKIDDLDGVVGARAYDVGVKDVDFLVYAFPKKSLSSDSRVARTWYVARFSRDGSYHGTIPLDLAGFSVQKLALLDTGDLVLFGLDETNRVAQLMHYSLIGGKTYYYQTDQPFANKNDSLPSRFAQGTHPSQDRVELAQLQGAVQFSQVIHYKDSILLLQMNAGAPVFQIFTDGSVRSIPLPKQAGFTADSLIPSDDDLYVRYRRVGSNTGRGDDARILEVDPATGDAIRQIKIGDFSMWDAVCERRGVFKVTKLNGEFNFQFFNATLKH